MLIKGFICYWRNNKNRWWVASWIKNWTLKDPFVNEYRINSKIQSSELYAFFQFTSVRRAYYSNESFSDVLNRFGVKSIGVLYDRKLKYDGEYNPQNVIDDCCKILNEMKIDTPSVEVVLLDDILIQRGE